MIVVSATSTPATVAYWLLGFFSCVGANVAVGLGLVVLAGYPDGIAFAAGFYQLPYVVPIFFVLRAYVHRSVSAGFITAAALALILSGGILALVYVGVLSA